MNISLTNTETFTFSYINFAYKITLVKFLIRLQAAGLTRTSSAGSETGTH